ncbi:uncharacterized protein LOC135577713 [Columba livia]|uniref:uncharacterized protein LOC135577713 n=1 Tax=Columba livia TaxID=8932 RepID=UPI0031B9D7F8
MEAMDNMLQALVLGSSASRVSELLQNIFQMLLTFTTSERECVQERAVGRIEKMSSALFRHPTLASCARYLRTSERTDIVLVFIEAMRDSSIFDKKRATDLLDMVMEFPDFWLADLPKIMRCIHKNLDGINTAPARQSVASLLLLMADRRPGKVLTTLLRIAPPGDRYWPQKPRGLVPCGERGTEPRNPAGHPRGAGPSIPPCFPALGVSQARSSHS